MVRNSVVHSPSLSPYASTFKSLVTVQEIEVFKPSLKAYVHLAKSVGKTTEAHDLQKIWLVSGNPFDIIGAKAAGLKAAWVDRGGKGWCDRLGSLLGQGTEDGQGLEPTIVVGGVEDAVWGIDRWERDYRNSRKTPGDSLA